MVEINVSQFVKECRKLRIVLADEKADPDILAECDNVITDATEPLMIMVMGEFSTGKSSFINALLGKDVTVVNATPTTAVITKLRYGRQEKVIVHYKDGRTEEQGVEEFARLSAQGDTKANAFHRKLSFVERVLPLKILKDLTIIDSPGLNSLVESHTQATKSFMGKADVVFWMFSVEDPVSRTELDAMRRLGARLKPVALVNKMDTIDEEEDDPDELLEQIRIKLDDQVQTVIGISAKTALDLMAKNPKADLTESGLPAVEGYIEEEILPNRDKYKMETMVDDMSGLMLSVLDDIQAKETNITEQKDKNYAAYMDARAHITLVRDQLSAATLEIYQYVQAKPAKNSTDLLFLAFLYQYGFIVEHNSQKRNEFLEQAALKNDADAQAYFGIELLSENAPEKAMYWLKKSFDQGNEKARAAIDDYRKNGIPKKTPEKGDDHVKQEKIAELVGTIQNIAETSKSSQEKQDIRNVPSEKPDQIAKIDYDISKISIAQEQPAKSKWPVIHRISTSSPSAEQIRAERALDSAEFYEREGNYLYAILAYNEVLKLNYQSDEVNARIEALKDLRRQEDQERKQKKREKKLRRNQDKLLEEKRKEESEKKKLQEAEQHHWDAAYCKSENIDLDATIRKYKKEAHNADPFTKAAVEAKIGELYEAKKDYVNATRYYNNALHLNYQTKKMSERIESIRNQTEEQQRQLDEIRERKRQAAEQKRRQEEAEKLKKWREEAAREKEQEAKKSWCFITTAVCNSFAKPDDCYELQSFRAFRDGWLRAQPDGAALIDEYYRVAPPIVKRIDACSDARRIYHRIWTKYLEPCLHEIEQGNYLACKKRYITMVRTLEKAFNS